MRPVGAGPAARRHSEVLVSSRPESGRPETRNVSVESQPRSRGTMGPHLDVVPHLAGLLEAGLDRRLDVGAAESGHFAQFARDLDAVVQQDAQFGRVHQPVGVGDQPEQI